MDELSVDTHLPCIGNKWEQVGKCFLTARNSARQETSEHPESRVLAFSACVQMHHVCIAQSSLEGAGVRPRTITQMRKWWNHQ